MSPHSAYDWSFLGQWFRGRVVRRSRTGCLVRGATSAVVALEARQLLAGTTNVTFSGAV